MSIKKKVIQGLIDLGAPVSVANSAYYYFGEAALELVRDNPYRLLEMGERSVWAVAERMAHGAGWDETNPLRVSGAVRHLLHQASTEGHVYLPLAELFTRMTRTLQFGDEQAFYDAIDSLADYGGLYRGEMSDEEGEKNETVYLDDLYRAETEVAKRLASIYAAPSRMGLSTPDESEIDRVQADLGIHFAAAQREAVSASIQDKIVLITGGPGTGKTTILRGMIGLWEQRGARIFLAAPTGRAAKRLAQSTGRNASTIHRMLEYNPDARRFNRNDVRPLKADLLVVDEASMIDVELMMHLLKALRPDVHLIFVGDVDQLPAVGPGLVLHDLIECEQFRTIHLAEIFRQREGSLISVNAQKINRGEMPELDGLGLDAGQDFFFINRPHPERAQEAVLEMAVDRIPKQFGLDARRDIQVLCPMIKRAAGVEKMNETLQDRLTPSQHRLGTPLYGVSIGDKIMQTKNDYSRDVFNGDIGYVTDIESRRLMITVDFDGRDVVYHLTEMDNTSLAYAMTVHKSQGSEFPAVIIPLVRQHYPMLQRNLIYTAVSRGKSLVVLVGDPNALAIAIRNNKIRTRYTALKQRIREAISG
ncbi:MAG: AAA family ATPase [bacterium]|nr:AAA family ATPase [bacterium]